MRFGFIYVAVRIIDSGKGPDQAAQRNGKTSGSHHKERQTHACVVLTTFTQRNKAACWLATGFEGVIYYSILCYSILQTGCLEPSFV